MLGERGRGTHRLDSDVDLGIYYREAIDLSTLREFALEVAAPGRPAR